MPIVPGHQAVGRVEKVGKRVQGWDVGERAGVAWLRMDLRGVRILAAGAREPRSNAQFTVGPGRGFAIRIAGRADFALHLPEGFDDLEAAPLLCGGVIGYRSLKISGIEPGGRLGLFGFRASALLALQVAHHWGCEVHVRTSPNASSSGRSNSVRRVLLVTTSQLRRSKPR